MEENEHSQEDERSQSRVTKLIQGVQEYGKWVDDFCKEADDFISEAQTLDKKLQLILGRGEDLFEEIEVTIKWFQDMCGNH